MNQEKFLVIRRDNIGDLICTLPLLRAIRHQRPGARLVVLANRYNAPVLQGNPDIDTVLAYQKEKHRTANEGLLSTFAQRLHMILQLRREHFDWIMLPGGYQPSAERLARWIGARHTVRLDDTDRLISQHEVELTCRLLPKVGLKYQTPPSAIYPDPTEVSLLRPQLDVSRHLVALHISARKPSQRWPAEKFIQLIHELHKQDPQIGFLLLWAPGEDTDAKHPGDDAKAQQIIGATSGLPVIPRPTHQLETLIATLSYAEFMICADGGAMHVAAGLGKRIVCLFGESDTLHWHPWNVSHELLQADSHNVKDISTSDVVSAFLRLQQPIRD